MITLSFILSYFLIKYKKYTNDVEESKEVKEKHEKDLQIFMWLAIIPTVLLILLVLYKVLPYLKSK